MLNSFTVFPPCYPFITNLAILLVISKLKNFLLSTAGIKSYLNGPNKMLNTKTEVQFLFKKEGCL